MHRTLFHSGMISCWKESFILRNLIVLSQPLESPNIQKQRMRLIDMFLDGHENSDLVVSLLWQRSPSTLLECFLDRYRRDPLSVSQILDIIQESKVSDLKSMY